MAERRPLCSRAAAMPEPDNPWSDHEPSRVKCEVVSSLVFRRGPFGKREAGDEVGGSLQKMLKVIL